MRYQLTPDLETGNELIDGEHRELFSRINRLLDACSVGRGREEAGPALAFLLDYVNTHFVHEEQLQRESKYPGYPGHHTFHTGYVAKLRELAAEIPATGATISDLSMLNRHLGILITHIRTDDKKLGAFLKKR